MKKIIGLVLYAGVMFGVTAGLGMFMLKKSAPETVSTDEDEQGDGSESDGPSDADIMAGYTPGSDATVDEHGNPRQELATIPRVNEEKLPVAVRATPMSVEEIVRMGLSLKSRDEVVRKREEALREIEAQQRLVLSDLASAQQDIENLLAQTTDQRAAKEELLARITGQNEAFARERQEMASAKEQLKADMEKFDQERKQFLAEKDSVARSENELAIKRKELDAERKLFEDTQTKVTLDGEKLVKDREAWLADQEKLASEKKQILADREQLRVDRDLFEQEKRALASGTTTSGASPTVTPKPVELDDATRLKNMKSVAQMLEGMSAENAALNIKTMAAGGNSDMVVEVLLLLEPRKSGAIMDALQDEQLASDFLLKMSQRNASSKAAKKP
jgi:hypothetical protein